jgi:hypothetical protein
VRFRLTYEGPLRPTQNEKREGQHDKLAPHKHAIRRCFHQQLKQLWATTKFLKETRVDPAFYANAQAPNNEMMWASDDQDKISYLEAVATHYHTLVTGLSPLCASNCF